MADLSSHAERPSNRCGRGLFVFYAVCTVLSYVIAVETVFNTELNHLIRALVPWVRNGATTIRPTSVAPEIELSLYWVRRVNTAATYADWFATPTGDVGLSAYKVHSSSSNARPTDLLSSGRSVLPLHAAYLFLLSRGVAVLRPDLLASVMASAQPAADDLAAFLWSAAVVNACVVLVVGVPVAWALMSRLADLLVMAMTDREEEAVAAAARREGGDDKGAVGIRSRRCSAAECEVLRQKLTITGALIIHVVGLLPVFVLEVTTLHPVCLCSVTVLGVVLCVVMDEIALHRGCGSTVAECKSNYHLDEPLLIQDTIHFFPRRTSVTTRYLCLAVLLVSLAGLMLTPFLYVAPLTGLWALTASFQRSSRRVFVRVRVPESERASCSDVQADGFVDVGFSSYRDTTYFCKCISRVFGTAVCVVMALCAPFWVGKRPLMDFMSLFGRAPIPSDAEPPYSLTSSGELRAGCLRAPYAAYTCARPAPNVWLLSEHSGLPWSEAMRGIAGLFSTSREALAGESQMCMDYVSIVVLVASHAAVLLALLAYRMRRPPLNFESPSQFASIREAEKQRFAAYVSKQHRAREEAKGTNDVKHAGGRRKAQLASPPPAATEEEKQQGRKAGVQATCISMEEYLLKQVALFLWMALVCTAMCCLLFVRNPVISYAPVGVIASALAALVSAVWTMRSCAPLSFDKDACTPQSKAGADRSADDCGDTEDDITAGIASRWCATSAAAIVEVADGIWLRAVILTLALLISCDNHFFANTFVAAEGTIRGAVIVVVVAGLLTEMLRTKFWTRMDIATVLLAAVVQVGSFYATWCTTAAHQIGSGADPALASNARPHSTAAAPERVMLAGQGWLRAFFYLIIRGIEQDGGDAMEARFSRLIHEHGVASVLLIGSALHATLRVVRLVLSEEEVSFLPPEQQFGYYG